MTLAKAKQIVVRDVEYPYALKFSKERYIGDSSSMVRLVFQAGKRYIAADFLSRKYDADVHGEGYERHINSWTPKHTSRVIEYYLDTGNIDNDLVMEDWEFCIL